MSESNGTSSRKKAGRNPTRNYHPTGGAWYGWGSAVLDGAPFFTWLDIPRMLRDPRVRLIERMWRAPFQRVKWKVHADNPKIEKFIDKTMRHFWRGSLPRILSRYFRYGYAPGGAEFGFRRGKIRLDRVRAVEPRDAVPRMYIRGPRRGQPAGFVIGKQVAGGSPLPPQENQPMERWVGAPHAFWFAGYQEFSHWFDMPPLSGLFEPWLEKRGRGGAIHIRRGWFRKNAIRGRILHYPPGTSNLGTDESPQVRDNQDIAREILDYAEANSTFTFVNDLNPGDTSKYAWHMEEAESTADVAGMLEYSQQLDKEMFEGAGIPPEVLEAADVGSGWSGRLIPLMGFLGGVDELAGMVIEGCDPWLRPLVGWNFGSAHYEIEPLSLAEEVQQQAKSGKGGGEGPNPIPGLLGQQGKGQQPGGEGGGGGGEPPTPRPPGPQKPKPVSMSTGDWDEELHPRDSGKFASKEGAGAATETPAEPHEDNKARRIIRALKHLPKRAVAKARKKVADTYAKLEQRYGPGYARVIVGAGIAGLPVPLPGASVMMAAPVLAIAELHKRLTRWGTPAPAEIDMEGVVKPAARWFLSRVFGRIRSALHLSTFDPEEPRDDSGKWTAEGGSPKKEFTSKNGVSTGEIEDAEPVSIPGHDHWRGQVIPPDKVTAIPKTKKARMALLKQIHNASIEVGNALVKKYGTRDAEDKMTPEEKALNSHLFFGVEMIGTGNDRDGPFSVPATDEQYTKRYRGLVKALDKLRQLAAQKPTELSATRSPEPTPEKSNATGKGKLTQGDRPQHQDGAEGGEATETGDSDSALKSGEGATKGQVNPLLMVHDRSAAARLIMLAMIETQKRAHDGADPEDAQVALDRLAELFADPEELSWTVYEGPRGGKGWKNDQTGRVVYGGNKPGEKREKQQASAVHAQRISTKIMLQPGTATAEDFRNLAAHIPALTVDELRRVRLKLSASFKNGRKRDEMVAALLNHAWGEIAEKKREEEPKKKKRGRLDTVINEVIAHGGIDPKSHELLAHMSGVTEARENGIPLRIFRKGGQGLDELAQELHSSGLIRVPEGERAGSYLLDQIQKRAHTLSANLDKQYEDQLHAHYALLEEAKQHADQSEIAATVQLGEEAGRAEATEDPDGDFSQDADSSEPDAEGVDTSFNFGANETAPEPPPESESTRGSDLVEPENRIMTPGQAARAESRGRQIAEQNASRIAADAAFEARRARAEQLMPGIGAMKEKQVKELGAKLGVKPQPGEKFGDYRAKVAAAHDMAQQTKPAVDIHDPAQLADAVHAAAAKLPDWRGHGAESGQFGGHKVYVSELYDAMKPQLGGVSLDDFKAALGKANAAGAVQAEPIDMPMYAKNPEQHERSAVSSGANVVGHAVRVTKPAPVQPLTPRGIAATQSAERANAPANMGLADEVLAMNKKREEKSKAAISRVQELYANALNPDTDAPKLRAEVADALKGLSLVELTSIGKELGYQSKPKNLEAAKQVIIGHVARRRASYDRADA